MPHRLPGANVALRACRTCVCAYKAFVRVTFFSAIAARARIDGKKANDADNGLVYHHSCGWAAARRGDVRHVQRTLEHQRVPLARRRLVLMYLYKNY